MRPSLPGGASRIDAQQLAGALLVLARAPRAPNRDRSPARGSPAASSDRLERARRSREDFDGAAAVVAQLGGGVGDAHEARVAEHRRRPVRELEVEPPADRHARRRPRPSPCRASRRRPKDAARARGRGFRRCRGTAHRARRAGAPARARAARAAPADDERPARRPQQVRPPRATASGRARRAAAASAAKCSASCSAFGTSARSVSAGKSR